MYSNEGISHGHVLAFTTTVAHKFNNSKFYARFRKLVETLNFSQINLNQSLDEAAETIISDRKHLDNNPISISKEDLLKLLKSINSKNYLSAKKRNVSRKCTNFFSKFLKTWHDCSFNYF